MYSRMRSQLSPGGRIAFSYSQQPAASDPLAPLPSPDRPRWHDPVRKVSSVWVTDRGGGVGGASSCKEPVEFSRRPSVLTEFISLYQRLAARQLRKQLAPRLALCRVPLFTTRSPHWRASLADRLYRFFCINWLCALFTRQAGLQLILFNRVHDTARNTALWQDVKHT